MAMTEVLEAEMPDDTSDAQRQKKELNFALGATAIFIILMMILASVVSSNTVDGIIDEFDYILKTYEA